MKNRILLIPLALLLAMSMVAIGCPAPEVAPVEPAPAPMAHLTMQVNPALQLSLDREHKVIGVEGLDENGKALVAQLDIQNKGLQQALQEITAALEARGFLSPERRIVIVLHPVDEREEENLPDLSAIAHQTVTERLVAMNVQIKVVSQVITEDLYETAIEEGLLPAAYADLIEANVSEASIKSIINLGKELGIEPELFLKEFYTIASAMIDMVEVGIPEDTAQAVLKEAMEADPSLKKFYTIASAMIDMAEVGIKGDAALALLEEAMKADPSLKKFYTIASAMIDMAEVGITEGDDPDQETQEEPEDEPEDDPEQ